MATTASDLKEAEGKDLLIVDLGRRGKKRIKALRKGRGRLHDDVLEALGELKSDGSIAAGAQPVIVIVKQKAGRGRC